MPGPKKSPGKTAAKGAAGTGKQGPHDGTVRVFPALPPAPGRRGFASAWWGEEWVAALEETSMDSGRLARGRTYARRGSVGAITVSPGRITAKVQGSAPRPYSSSIRVRVLDDGEWDRLLDAVAAKALHIAALLDRDMPQELVDDAARARVLLLPGDDELDPDCSCPDWGYPCKHAAALCYQIARILDEDPFVLLLMRGRGEAAIMAELHKRNTARAAVEQAAAATATATGSGAAGGRGRAQGEGGPDGRGRVRVGVPARDAFAAWRAAETGAGTGAEAGIGTGAGNGTGTGTGSRTAGFDIALVDPVEKAGSPVALEASAPVAGFDPQALEMLAAGAAAQAKTLLDAYLDPRLDDAAADGDPRYRPAPPLVPELDEHRDAVRLLAGEHRDVHVFARLVEALGVEPTQVARGIIAWRHDGAAGFDVLEEAWTPPAAQLARARALLDAGWDEGEEGAPAPRARRNRWTFAEHDIQLRYGRDGRWYPYRKRDDGAWWPAGPAGHDPADILTALL